MSEISYRPLIEDMTWSYSRIESFESCPYKWFLHYIKELDEKPMFYAQYGKFIHKLIEMYCRKEITKDEMVTKFLIDFRTEVTGARPSEKIASNYISTAIEYLKSFEPFPYNMVDVEKKIYFDIGENKFVGIIDYIGEKDGDLYMVDNKSRDLKPRSKRAKPTVKDKELDDMLRQLYIYAGALKKEYGKFPKALCFNCYRTGTFIEEPFDETKYNEAIEWAKKTIEDIKDTEEFWPNREFYFCTYLCGLHDECCYDQSERRGGGRKL